MNVMKPFFLTFALQLPVVGMAFSGISLLCGQLEAQAHVVQPTEESDGVRSYSRSPYADMLAVDGGTAPRVGTDGRITDYLGHVLGTFTKSGDELTLRNVSGQELGYMKPNGRIYTADNQWVARTNKDNGKVWDKEGNRIAVVPAGNIQAAMLLVLGKELTSSSTIGAPIGAGDIAAGQTY